MFDFEISLSQTTARPPMYLSTLADATAISHKLAERFSSERQYFPIISNKDDCECTFTKMDLHMLELFKLENDVCF